MYHAYYIYLSISLILGNLANIFQIFPLFILLPFYGTIVLFKTFILFNISTNFFFIFSISWFYCAALQKKVSRNVDLDGLSLPYSWTSCFSFLPWIYWCFSWTSHLRKFPSKSKPTQFRPHTWLTSFSQICRVRS